MIVTLTPRASFLQADSDEFSFADTTTNHLSSNISPSMHSSSVDLSSKSSVTLDSIPSIPAIPIQSPLTPHPSASFSLLADGITRGRGRHAKISKESSRYSELASPAMNKTSAGGSSRRNPNITSLPCVPLNPNGPFYFMQHSGQPPTASSASVSTTSTHSNDDRSYACITKALWCVIGNGEVHVSTMDLIWNCINRVYDPEVWGTILVTCGMDKGWIGMIIEVMKAAKQVRH